MQMIIFQWQFFNAIFLYNITANKLFDIALQAKNCDFFKQYVTEDFSTYLTRKRSEHCHGNHVEMQALCELYNRPIEVYQLSIGGYSLLLWQRNFEHR